ncbi:MAG: LysM peptidoglycan-binding domain-containing protein, partial [Proteobacteria bacterium]|nr:LysM peptidoglycan-binding domain-containing protein [Pseudomonadota bacterium]
MPRLLVLPILLATLSACASLTEPFQSSSSVSTPDVTQNSAVETRSVAAAAGDASYPAQLAESDEIRQLLLAAAEEDAEADLWQRVRTGFELTVPDNRRVQQELDWYARHPDYMQRVAERANPYMYYVVDVIEENNMPSELALLPIVESAFQPFAYSHGRAAGIWQFIPSTGKRFGLQQNWWYDGRRDVYASTRAAVELLNTLHRQFNGDWLLALAAYNSGAGTVKKAIRRNQRRGKPTDFWSLDLPQETRAYVPKLLALKKLIAQPTDYDLALPTIPDQPYFARVELGSQIDLARAAKLAQITLDELYRLNPGYNRWATAPDGPHHLLIPLDRIETFSAGLAALPADQRISWIRYRIRSGDTLSTIAAKHRISITTLKKVNHIRGTQLRAGRSLMIPVASQSASSYRLSATQRKQTQQNQPRKGTRVVHIVRKGDTFWDLSRKHNVSTRALAKWNGMAPRDPLVPGQKLVIWSRTTTTSSHLEPAVLTLPTQRSITKRIGYKVRRGDSLDKISRKFRVSISQLRRWNNLPKGKYLQPGQRLTLY